MSCSGTASVCSDSTVGGGAVTLQGARGLWPANALGRAPTGAVRVSLACQKAKTSMALSGPWLENPPDRLVLIKLGELLPGAREPCSPVGRCLRS